MLKTSHKKMVLIIILLIFATISISFVYSSSFPTAIRDYNNPYHFLFKQFFWYVIGFFMMIVGSQINYKFYKKNMFKIYIFGLILLIAVLIIGHSVNGAKRWISFAGVSFQPSDFAKIFFLMYFAGILENFKKYKKKDLQILIPSLGILIIYLGFIFLEKNFGTIVILGGAALLMLFYVEIKKRYFFILAFLAVIVSIPAIVFSHHRITRIISYIHGMKTIGIGGGYQVKQSIIGIGHGGLLGLGFGNGLQKYYYLPELHTDFIFSVIGEEGGFILTCFVIILFIVFMYIGFKTALDAKDYYAKYLVAGIFTMIVIQALLNLLVVTGMIPATGRPLPFISFGGSSVVVLLFSMGIVLNIIRKE